VKRLPVALIAGFALQLGVHWGRDVMFVIHPIRSRTALVLALGAAHLAVATMLAIGLHDLAQRTAGRAGRALRVAVAFSIAIAGLALLDVAREAFATGDPRVWWEIQRTLAWAMNLGVVVAVAVAAWNRLAILAVAVFAVAWLPDFLHAQLPDLLPDDVRRFGYDLASTLRVAALLAALASTAAAEPTPRPALALRGLALATHGAYLRIAGFAASVLFGLVVFGSHGDEGVAVYALYGGIIVNVAAFALVGLGALKALRSSHAALDSLAMGFAAVANLWCAGAMLDKLAVYYRAVHGDDRYWVEDAGALDLTLPIVATIGGVFLTIALARFARDRGDAPLATRAAASGVGYTLLMIASTGIASSLVTEASSLEGMVAMMLISALCGLASQIVMGRLCKRSADALADGAALPTATVV